MTKLKRREYEKKKSKRYMSDFESRRKRAKHKQFKDKQEEEYTKSYMNPEWD